MTNMLRFSLGIAVTACLIGCSKAETPAAEAANDTEVAAPVAAPAAPPAAAPAAPAAAGLGPDFMVGKWSAMGSCDDTLEFRKDGSVATPFGPGRWTLAGDQLSVEFDGDTGKQAPSTIARIDENTIRITQPSGKSETQKRC